MQCKAKGSSVFFVLLLIVWDQKKGRKGSKAAKKESVCEESRAVDWRKRVSKTGPLRFGSENQFPLNFAMNLS